MSRFARSARPGGVLKPLLGYGLNVAGVPKRHWTMGRFLRVDIADRYLVAKAFLAGAQKVRCAIATRYEKSVLDPRHTVLTADQWTVSRIRRHQRRCRNEAKRAPAWSVTSEQRHHCLLQISQGEPFVLTRSLHRQRRVLRALAQAGGDYRQGGSWR